jgi:hypothetical protein
MDSYLAHILLSAGFLHFATVKQQMHSYFVYKDLEVFLMLKENLLCKHRLFAKLNQINKEWQSNNPKSLIVQALVKQINATYL